MKRSIKAFQLLGFAVTALSGTLLHFLYDWTGKSLLAAPFSSVNESTWEHMKLLFWPMLAFAAVESLVFKELSAFWCVKLRGVLLGLSLIPILFYTYNGVIGKSPDWVNIAIFFIAAAVAFLYETRKLENKTVICRNPRLSLALLLALAFLFVLFTFKTPTLAIFRDPVTGGFGILAKSA